MLILLSKKIMATGDICILVADLHCCMAETSEYWQRTPGTRKGSPFSSKGGRTKYKRQKERLELGMETCHGEGVVKEETFLHSRKLSHRRVCGEFWSLRRQHNRKRKKTTHRIHT